MNEKRKEICYSDLFGGILTFYLVISLFFLFSPLYTFVHLFVFVISALWYVDVATYLGEQAPSVEEMSHIEDYKNSVFIIVMIQEVLVVLFLLLGNLSLTYSIISLTSVLCGLYLLVKIRRTLYYYCNHHEKKVKWDTQCSMFHAYTLMSGESQEKQYCLYCPASDYEKP